MCYTYRTKYSKYNRLYKLKHYRDMVWCCKANFKTNSLWLKTLKGKLYSHFFKCANYKNNYQMDSYNCLFWKHRFNCDWHNKKFQELREIRANSICSSVGNTKQWFYKTSRFFVRMFVRIVSSLILF